MASVISNPGRQVAQQITDALKDLDVNQSWLGMKVAEIEGRTEGPFSQSATSQWIADPESLRPHRVFSIEKALGREPGSLSRTLGYLPASVVPAVTVPAAIAADPRLTEASRRILLSTYNSALERSGGSSTDHH